jgi:hypothetical protein
MRENHRIQPTLAEPWLDVPHAKELKVVSDLLDAILRSARWWRKTSVAGGAGEA